MRIVGGVYRSRLISMPKGAETRPTQDRVREAVFNLLRDVSGKRVLELFAGSGAFGIEAISRGANHATFVDNSPRCVEAIKTNLEALEVPIDQHNIIRANGLGILSGFEGSADKFDLIFLDPPYYKGMAKKCLIIIDSCDILSRIGLVVVERFRKDDLPLDLRTIKMEKERRYGDTVITIFRKIT